MPGTITVDTTDESATLAFVDDKGNETPAPAEAVVNFSSSNPDVATIDSGGSITPVGVGETQIAVTVDGAMEPDGVTPIPNPDPITLTVDPGAAVGERLTVGPN